MEFSFESLYNYIDSTGIIVPVTPEIKTSVENTFKQIFGADLDVSEETAVGRLIEAISILFVGVLGVNALNANNFNINTASGIYLDMLANIFGITRGDEDDETFRKRILMSQSRGIGYVKSIMNSVSKVDGVTSVYVLDNGHGYNVVKPNSETGITIYPHSVFVCVNGGDDNAIAEAIARSKPAGVNTHRVVGDDSYVIVSVEDEDTGSVDSIAFRRPDTVNPKITIDVSLGNYTGSDIVSTTKQSVIDVIRKNGIGTATSVFDISSAVAGNGTSTIVRNVKIYISSTEVEKIIISPTQIVSVGVDDITVNIIND